MIKDNLKAASAIASGWLPDVLMVAGAGGVSYGAGMVYLAAGWIVGGLFALAAGWMLAKGGK